jgi:predicted negative regulator of RcsB-dependent stress response
MKQQQQGGVLFYSCAPPDSSLCEQLASVLYPLVREAHLSEWAEHRLPPGTDIVRARQQGWRDATLILLLLSPDYLASDTCYHEMLNALERQQRGEVRVLPILLRPCDRSAPPLATVRCLPDSGQAVTSWGNQEQAFLDIAQEIRQLLGLPRVVISGGRGQLPRVRDAGLDQLGVHAARVEVPYIERDRQEKLEEAVGPGLAALVVWHSMAGKTRLAAEVVKRKFPDALLLPAESGKALRERFDGGLDPEGLVVWLDNLERFLTDGLTVGLLDRLITGSAIVVATIRTLQRETWRPSDKLWPPEWEVLQRFNQISLQRRLSDSELGRVRATVNDPGVLAGVNHYGLAEYLGAGPEALDKFEQGETANPVGHALVRAAVDWRLTGLTRPVSQQVLATMLPTYLADRRDVPRTNQAIDEGLAWATAKINETVALLGQVFTGSNGPVFEAFDYLVDQLTSSSTPVPDPIWALALEQAEPAELSVIGLAAFNLGKLLEKQDDVEGAKAAHQRAIDSGNTNTVTVAAFHLAGLLKEQGDVEGAKTAFQRAIDRIHADQDPQAAFSLGILLKEQGDVEGAKAVYQRVIDSGNAYAAIVAALNLGMLLKEQGDEEGAKAAFQRAFGSSHRPPR